MILLENNQTNDSNDSNESASAVVIDQTEPAEEPGDDSQEVTSVARYSYPLPILLFWGITVAIFVVRFFVLCVWIIPIHLEVFNKRKAIGLFTKNQEYFLALQLHEELCKAYPKHYADEHALEIAEACFQCLSIDKTLFKKGINYLRGRKIQEEEFVQLHLAIPDELEEDYLALFDAYYRKKWNEEKMYYFILNDDKVKML